MQTTNPLLVFLVGIALTVGGVSLYIGVNKRSCECPAPRIHDDRDRDRWDRDNGRPRKRPDGSTGDVGQDTPIVKRDM